MEAQNSKEPRELSLLSSVIINDRAEVTREWHIYIYDSSRGSVSSSALWGDKEVTDTFELTRAGFERRVASASATRAIMSGVGNFYVPTHHPPVALVWARGRVGWTGVRPRVGG